MKDLSTAVDRLVPDGLAFLERMVGLESPSYDADRVNALGQYVAEAFEQLGGTVERHTEPDRGDHLLIRFDALSEGAGRPPIMLLGHLDTVWPAGTIADRPFTIDGDTATGPGIFDMKAGVAMMWMALSAFRSVRGGPPAPVQVLLTSNEEVGSGNVRELVPQLAATAGAVLVLEPSLPDGVLKTARNGMGRFTVRAIGKATHSGVNPADGVNAVEEIAHQVLRLGEIQDLEKGTTVTVTMVQGGTRPNVVPAECHVQTDCRVPTLDEADRVTRAIQGLLPVLKGARIEVEGEFRRPPLEANAANMRLFEMARRVGGECGIRVEGGSTGGASDGNLTSAAGIPTLDGLGPVGLGAHQIDEQIQVSSLGPRTTLVAGLIDRIAAG